MKTRNIVHSLTVANWNGVFFKTLNYDPLITNLVGHTGAGKTTLMIAHITAMIPDKRLLHFRNPTETGQNPFDKGDKGLYGRIGENGACYSVIDYRLKEGERVLVGVQLRRKTKPEIDLIPFHIAGITNDIEVKDLLLVKESEQTHSIAEMEAIRNNVATYGGTLKQYSKLTEYMSFLFEKRIIPKRMTQHEERKQYYSLLETSLYGGLKSEIQKGLRDYLLASDSTVQTSVSSMQNALKESQLTRVEIEKTKEQRQFISNTYKNAWIIGSATLVSEELKANLARKTAAEAKQTFKQLQAEFLNLETECQNLSQDKTRLEEESKRSNEVLNQAIEYEKKAKVAESLHSKITDTKGEIKTATDSRQQEQAKLKENELAQQSANDKMSKLEKNRDELTDQLTSIEKAYKIEARNSALYELAQTSLNNARQALPDKTIDESNVELVTRELEQEYQRILQHSNKLQTERDLAKTKTETFNEAYQLLNLLSEYQVSEEEAFQAANKLDDDCRDKEYQVKQIDEFYRHLTELEILGRRQRDIQEFVKKFSNDIVITTEQAYQDYQKSLHEKIDYFRQQELDYLRQEHEVQRQLADVEENRKKQTELLPKWQDAQRWKETLVQATDIEISKESNIYQVQDFIRQSLMTARESKDDNSKERDTLCEKIINLEQTGYKDSVITSIKEQIGGTLVADFLEDISIEEAPYIEAKYGPLRDAMIVPNVIQAAKNTVQIEERPESVWLIEGKIEDSFAEDEYLTDQGTYSDSILVKMGNINRLTRLPEHPVLGDKARQKEIERLTILAKVLQEEIETQSVSIKKFEKLEKTVHDLWRVAHCLFVPDPDGELKKLESEKNELTRSSNELERQKRANAKFLEKYEKEFQDFYINAKNASLLDRTTLSVEVTQAREKYQFASDSQLWLKEHGKNLQRFRNMKGRLETLPPKNLAKLTDDAEQAEQMVSQLGNQKGLMEILCTHLPYFQYADAEENIEKKSGFQQELQQKLEQTRANVELARSELKAINSEVLNNEKAIARYEEKLKGLDKNIYQYQQELVKNGVTYFPTLVKDAHKKVEEARKHYTEVINQLKTVSDTLTEKQRHHDRKNEEKNKASTNYQDKSKLAIEAICSWRKIKQESKGLQIDKRLSEAKLSQESISLLGSEIYHLIYNPKFSQESISSLKEQIIKSQVSLQNILANDAATEKVLNAIKRASSQNNPSDNIWLFDETFRYLSARMDRNIIHSDDPLKAIKDLSDRLTRLEERLKSQEEEFKIKSGDVINIIERNIKREKKRIQKLNNGLREVKFGSIGSISLNMQVLDSFLDVLHALSNDRHTDLFAKHTIEDAFAEIYQRETGNTIKGEQMLDYRNYIRLQIEVQRQGNKKHEIANPTDLSTGEAIGTGLSVLLMVLQSWEENTHKNEGKGQQSSRFLFLDEAARLDSKSITMLIELCEKMELQLLIAAPIVEHQDKGTTHKLVRKNINGKDQVSISQVFITGIKGSGTKGKEVPNDG